MAHLDELAQVLSDQTVERFQDVHLVHTTTIQVAGGISAGGVPNLEVVMFGPGVAFHSGISACPCDDVGTRET